MRNNVYWNPSFNVTERSASSNPLLTETSPDVWEVTDPGILIPGLKNGEVSTGLNQQVTARDAVFSYLAYANPNVSISPVYHEWISDIYVDELDPLSFHVHIDGNPKTPTLEPYVDMWSSMAWYVLPEFYLNSSNPVQTYSSGGVKTWGLYDEIFDTPQWSTYSSSSFGCGKFMLDYYVQGSLSVLTRSPFWNGVGQIDGTQDMKAFVKTINVRDIPDRIAVLAEFKAGKIDITGVTSFPEERREMQTDPRFEIQSSIEDVFSFLIYNLQRPFIGGADNYIFLDVPGKEEYTNGVAVRKAISYAIDREEINNVFHSGEYILSHSPIYPYTTFYYYNEIIKYYRDLDLALKWLNYAGYGIIVHNSLSIFNIFAALGAATVSIMTYRKRR
jgi:ABC-type transport system substrate-binding protein